MAGAGGGGYGGASAGGGYGGWSQHFQDGQQITSQQQQQQQQGQGSGGSGGGSLQEQSYASYQAGGKSGIPPGMTYDEYVNTYFGGGGSTGGAQSGAGSVGGDIGALSEAGQGLLDPESDYYRQLQEEQTRSLGAQGEAQQRSAVLRASQAGLGMGASPELLETQGDIGRSTLEAQGQASADLALQAPALGHSMLGTSIGGELGAQGLEQQGHLAQEQLRAEQEWQQLQADMERERLEQEAYLREQGLLLSGYD